jgi:hypothetical protein
MFQVTKFLNFLKKMFQVTQFFNFLKMFQVTQFPKLIGPVGQFSNVLENFNS